MAMDKGVWLIAGLTLSVLGVITTMTMSTPKSNESNNLNEVDNVTVSEAGIHWHPELAIYIKGQKQEIPANIGLGGTGPMGMEPLHTHDTSGQLHAEWEKGPITKGHLKLARFFEAWGKPFSKDQILDFTTSDGGKITMTVNGQANNEYQNYVMADGDKIEIRYD